MTQSWFTSDTHFGHDAIVKLSKRPFASAEEMDAKIIANWNRVVSKHDHVWHCGDFAWRNLAEYRNRLNGVIHLIRGNHDRLKTSDKALFASIDDLRHIKVDEQDIYLCHYAMRVWNKSHYGSWHLYGHSHGSLADDWHALSLDVGVDCWDFTPVSMAQLKERMDKKVWQSIDHHGKEGRFDQQPG